MQRVLIIDDEEAVRKLLRISLSSNGYQTQEVATGTEGVDAVLEREPDLVILDHSLPDLNGLQVTRYIRSHSWVPILFLSAVDDERVKIEALDAGADDYLTKPFSLSELMARLRAASRRRSVVPAKGALCRGPFELRPDLRTASRDGIPLSLTPTEFSILKVLLEHWDAVLKHREILSLVWGPTYAEETQILRVNVANLRRKIEPDPRDPIFLLNVPGVGYRLTGPAAD